ncbi:FtsX-like permease family protein [Lactococcus termiticola]|uniref:Antimicrobial peptide ABC transporter permease protein n=1 Tax=Lactococcus termiticola TaxID=2169526 RepID=A0A2R5HIP2_9LACT|nr:ABC transporter permease [Lactococcus termiticola]GBG96220.1 antimicrobial peptide ABC transporter permease protein [Lactococcus termiticola]
MLTFKLAKRNLQAAFKSFAPFLMATVTMFVLLFVTAAIAMSPSVKQLKGGEAVSTLMTFSMIILAVFGAMILVYSYRFLQLQRLREFGLYDILGFGKPQIAMVSFWELILSYLATLVVGILAGLALSKFLFLIFVNIIGGNYFNLVINPTVIGLVAFIFLVYFLILFLVGSWIIYRSSSLDLLHESSKGEKEPKGNIILALVGLIFLGVGYYLALSVDNPIKAITTFFFAVLAVIIGTYLFYIAVTVWYLRWRKKRASYYQPQNFINISSMLYRMKQNAVGLANITVLLTMTLVTLAVTVGIFAGTTASVNKQYPREGQVVAPQDISREVLTQKVKETAEKLNVPIGNLATIQASVNTFQAERNSDSLKLKQVEGITLGKGVISFQMTTVKDLEAMGIEAPTGLLPNQVYAYDLSGKPTENLKQIDYFGQELTVKDHLSSLRNWPQPASFSEAALLVFADDASLKATEAAGKKNDVDGLSYAQTIAIFDMPKDKNEAFDKAITNQTDGIGFAGRQQELDQSRAFVGGFLFIGFVLGISFILGAALIIYYKQLAEGYQDKKAFKTLQELGLSQKEVHKTIAGQVRMVFFLPVVIAAIHFAFAYRMLSKLINIFSVNDPLLIIGVSGLVLVVILVLYALIYKSTSRIYYQIVKRK